MAAQPPLLEAVWRELRAHLALADGFVLIFLFARHPQPIALLRQRLEESGRLRSVKPFVSAPGTPGEAIESVQWILDQRPGSGGGMPRLSHKKLLPKPYTS